MNHQIVPPLRPSVVSYLVTRGSLWAPLLMLAALLIPSAQAEQSKKVGPFDVHYVAIPTTFLTPEIARQYDIVRGKDRAMVNLSILDDKGGAVSATVKGTMKNLPGQVLPLKFVEVREGDALYYIASVRFTDQEIVRFKVEFSTDVGSANQTDETYELEFQQKLYWEP